MARARRTAWVVIALGLLMTGCSSRQPHRPLFSVTKPVYHRVSAGETLYGIGLKYGVPYMEIARANYVRDPERIQIGQLLLIPRVRTTKTAPVVVGKPSKRWWWPGGKGRGGGDPRAPEFGWPVSGGTVTSGFGARNGRAHEGVDIAAPVGSIVRAAADGRVQYSGWLPGYGNVLIVRHSGGYATVYGHNHNNHAKEGQRVEQGQFIATVGTTGRVSGPNLHFEIRKNDKPRDPLPYLWGDVRVGAREGEAIESD